MKQKIVKALTSRWAQLVIALVLSLIMTRQEIGLGNQSTAWMIGACVAVGFGAMWEVFRYVMTGDGFQWINITVWIIGGALGIGTGYLM